MEMDVNLVRCLRSTVGMSDIDRCYNEFVINGLNTSSIINHNNSNQQQHQQQQHQPQQFSLTTTNKSNNNINFNHNSNHQNASSSSTASYQIKPLSVLLKVQPSTSMTTRTTTTETTTYEKCNRPLITTISGNLVNNETNDVNKHLSIIHNNNIDIHHDNDDDDDGDNDGGDDDDDDDNSNVKNQSNIINDNRIDYQQYYNNSMSLSITTTTATATKKSSSAVIISQLPPPTVLSSSSNGGGGGGGGGVIKNSTSILLGDITTPTTPISKGCCITLGNRQKINKTPQEIYFESRGKSCKKLLKFNGYSNKILLYPEESWARSAASSYWTIKPSWWQPNRCKVTEITGSQRYSTKAKMLCIEKGSLLVMGSFKKKLGDSDFKLYLSSNITMEDYNMGYCLTGWVERRCSQTNTFQMTHFAVIKRQWPPSTNTTTATATTTSNTNNNSNSANNNSNANAAATNDSKSN